MIKGKFYSSKCQEHDYSPKLQNCIEKACQYCINSLSLDSNENTTIKPIMMLGKIQSGKTRAFTGLMALAFDNCFDMAIILTKNSVALHRQTYKRMRREFNEFINGNEVDVFDIMNVIDGLTDYELDKKLILVGKKETRNLDKISKFISDYTINLRKYCLIIDDEADTASIGFSKVKDIDNEFDLRTIASKVNTIRGSLDGCVFVQVTATPYALYLQPNFNEKDIEPVRPQLTVLVPSGDDYIGGEYYFIGPREEGNPAAYIYEEVSPEEHNIITLKKEDRRRFKDENILINREKLCVFKKGIMNFIVGGCLLRMVHPNTHYSFVIHTATQKAAHIRIENITDEFRAQLKTRNSKTEPIIEELLIESYKDIEKSVKAYGHKMPCYDEIKSAFFQAIDKDYISVTIVNSNQDVKKVLDEENGELRLRTPLSIFVGGQVLDRGVTIPNMIGFFYGRNPKIMQQDTVLQHSRMFGYRDKDLLSVTRFYTTRHIYENMTKITEIDMALREDINKGRFEDSVYFVREDEKGQIVPCSPEKIRMSNIVMLKAGRRIFPIGFSPVAKTYSSRYSQQIDRQLSKIIDNNNKGAVLVSVSILDEIINTAYKAIKPDEDAARFVTQEQFISTLRYLSRNENKAYLLVRRGRKVSKYKENGSVYTDAPDTSQDELSLARSISEKYPVLMMIHQDGTAVGWNGCEFWWPILLTQKNMPKTIFALDEPGGGIRNR
jgi:hypothetical protein